MENAIVESSEKIEDLYLHARDIEAVNFVEALELYESIIIQAEEKERYDVMIDSLNRTIIPYVRLNQYFKALRQAGLALKLTETHLPDDNLRLAISCKSIGIVYVDGFRKHSEGLNYFFKALRYDAAELNCMLYNNIGSLYKDSLDYDKAMEYLIKGRSMALRRGEKITLVYVLENMARIYVEKAAYEKGKGVCLEALEVCNELVTDRGGIHYLRGFILNDLANIYLKTGKREKALPLLDEAIAIAMSRNDVEVVAEALILKGNHALEKEEDDVFIESINKAINFTKGSMSYAQVSCLKLLKDYYYSKKQFEEACKIADQIIEINEQIDTQRERNSMIDLLEQQESEIQILEKKNKMISQQRDELEQFAYIVAHDLKEPLRNIGSYCGLIKKRYIPLLDDEGIEFFNFIINSSSHMYTMLEDLLKYATLEDDEDGLMVFDTNKALEKVVYRLGNIEQNENINIQFKNLPEVSLRMFHFNILFDNLIKNAIKFRHPDRPLLIKIEAIQKNDKIRFAVTDNGQGIAAAYHQSIFQIFKRLEKNRTKGTGIGLAICKKIVEIYQGNIWVESVAGEGSTFYFTIDNKTV